MGQHVFAAQAAGGGASALWSEHKVFVFIALAVFVGQLALIAGLLAQRRRWQLAERALRQSEARNSAILRAIPDLMFVFSRDGVYVDYNAPSPAALFVAPDQFLGKHIRDVLPKELTQSVEPLFEKAMKAEQPVSLDYTLPMDGTDHYFEARLVRCDNDTIVCIVRDVTDRHRATEQLHQAQTDLAQATRVRSLGEIATGIAHEVSQPLAAMITNARAGIRRLDAACGVEEMRGVLQDIVADGQRASGVITRIRGLVKHTPMRLTRLDVNDVIDDVVGLSGPMLRQHQIRLDVERKGDLPPVTGDRIQLQQVLLNLVINATDAMKSVEDRPRVLEIRTGQRNSYVSVRIQDSGPGLAESAVRRIFTPFFSTKPEGMGVGLSISRSIVEAHGGRLDLASNSSDGATFELELPMA
ncbi:MAG TPA: ATP-binding protein [Vicinamibacterales bacterium]|nr:ATP-binding protein [Vicinamibacterales bacterium]